MTTTARKCPACGSELAAGTVAGVCAKCLMKQGLTAATTPGPLAPTLPVVEPVATQTLNPALGTRLRYFGDYELLEEIARGGMGMVYRARQVSLNRVVALKMILSGQLATDAEVRRFRVEAEAAANLQHPNIVAIHEVGEFEGRHYFTMDFVEGRNLAQLADGKPLPPVRAAAYVKTIAEAIHFAHQRGTLHRDLKPQNVMVDAADRVRITDFGLAKQTQADSSLTRTGTVMGSPSYMPPEQAQGRQDLVGPPSDVYSLGAILYELLTGRPPFAADSPMATVMKVLNTDPVPPRQLNDAIPADLETVCLKCLEKRPEQRYTSARALAEELDRFLKGEPILARPAGALRRALGWSRRHRAVMTALISALVLGLTGLAYGLWQQTRYLTWLNAHPGWPRVAGPRTATLKGLSVWGSYAWIIMVYVSLWYRKLSRRMPWRSVFDPAQVYLPVHPVAPNLVTAFAGLGVAAIVLSLWLAARSIEAFVWEGTVSWVMLLGGVYAVFFFGLMLARTVLREQAGAALGLAPMAEPSQLPPERLDPICGALYGGRKIEAIRLYREATGVGLREARQQVELLAGRLYQEQPDRFCGDPNQPPPVRPVRLVVLTLAGLLVLTLGLPLFPPRLYPSWPVAFVAGVVSGLGVMLTARNRRFCHQFLGVLPVALTGLLMEAVTRACNPGMNYWLPWLLGMFAGILLVNASRRKAMPHAAMPAVAGMAASAAQAPAAVSSAAAAVATGAAGAVGGAAIGIAGAYFGAKASIENTRSPRERRFMIRMTWWCMAGALLFTLAIFALTWLGRSLGQKHPVCFGVLVAVVIVVYSVGLTVFILLANRRQRQIRLEDQAAAEAGRRVG